MKYCRTLILQTKWDQSYVLKSKYIGICIAMNEVRGMSMHIRTREILVFG